MSVMTEAKPLYLTPKSDTLPNRLDEYQALAGLLGWALMPWQEAVIERATEYHPSTEIPRWRRVVITVPRQSGKTTLLVLVVLWRMLAHPGVPQQIAWLSQGLTDSKNLWENAMPRIEEAFPEYNIKMRKSLSDCAIKCHRNGSQCRILSSSQKAGHGMTLGLSVVDEAWAFQDERVDQTLVPTMRAVPDGQMWITSTAGLPDSIWLRRMVESGRAGSNDREGHVMYGEWGAPAGAPPYEEETWAEAIPSIGYTTNFDMLRQETELFTEMQWRRAGLNQWPEVGAELILPQGVWSRAQRENVAPAGDMWIGIDTAFNREWSAVAAVDRHGNIEVIASGAGADWVLKWVTDLFEKHPDIQGVACRRDGPAGQIGAQLKSKGIQVKWLSKQDWVWACGAWHDAVLDGSVLHRSSEALSGAVYASIKAEAPNGWRFAAKKGEDISPLVAVVVGFWASSLAEQPMEKPDYVNRPTIWRLE